MSAGTSDTTSSIERIQALELRVQQLENELNSLRKRLDFELPEVPWAVICAAVAAVLPDVEIKSISRILPDSHPEIIVQNLWSVGGRLDLFTSHRIR
ncbi:MAG: hypothetical protein N2035_05130 [Chthoniobacterales bacterium]|nr:hypothetical protein [Chthoniobacterales bacterium]